MVHIIAMVYLSICASVLLVALVGTALSRFSKKDNVRYIGYKIVYYYLISAVVMLVSFAVTICIIMLTKGS